MWPIRANIKTNGIQLLRSARPRNSIKFNVGDFVFSLYDICDEKKKKNVNTGESNSHVHPVNTPLGGLNRKTLKVSNVWIRKIPWSRLFINIFFFHSCNPKPLAILRPLMRCFIAGKRRKNVRGREM